MDMFGGSQMAFLGDLRPKSSAEALGGRIQTWLQAKPCVPGGAGFYTVMKKLQAISPDY
jgi:hypothetical protein